MTLSTKQSLALVALAACALSCTAASSAGAQSFAAPNGYPESVFEPVLRNDPGAGTAESPRLQRQVVSYDTREAPGTIVIDTPNTYLYLVLGNGRALRYGIGVGREGFTWSGVETISRMAEWPDWFPPSEMIARQPYLPRFMAGGPGNPLGARALYLGSTAYRIHGTNDPTTIGHQVSSGCIRLTNENVTDLFSRVRQGTKVVVLPQTGQRASPRVSARTPTAAVVPVSTVATRSESNFAFGIH
jgi:lipoprotein-anchoring transpeptidase ErfK/SrfK